MLTSARRPTSPVIVQGAECAPPSIGETTMNALQLLKADHQEVAALFQEFETADSGDKAAIAEQVCQKLTVHAQIEEEIFYPAAREALQEEGGDLIDEATVEHASVKDLVEQIDAS